MAECLSDKSSWTSLPGSKTWRAEHSKGLDSALYKTFKFHYDCLHAARMTCSTTWVWRHWWACYSGRTRGRSSFVRTGRRSVATRRAAKARTCLAPTVSSRLPPPASLSLNRCHYWMHSVSPRRLWTKTCSKVIRMHSRARALRLCVVELIQCVAVMCKFLRRYWKT